VLLTPSGSSTASPGTATDPPTPSPRHPETLTQPCPPATPIHDLAKISRSEAANPEQVVLCTRGSHRVHVLAVYGLLA
jgi:hypothetical protein